MLSRKTAKLFKSTLCALAFPGIATVAWAQDGGALKNRFVDNFNGNALKTRYWSTFGTGQMTVGGGTLSSSCRAYASTQGKLNFSGETVVVEGRFFSSNGLYDANLFLVDTVSQDYIQAGDTNYGGFGFYVFGSGAFGVPHSGTGVMVNDYREYRLTLSGTSMKLERGPTLSQITETITRQMGTSVSGRTFALILGTGGPDYCNTVYDWVRVKTTRKLEDDDQE